MASAATNPKQQAHQLIERISTAHAPFEDEEISQEENRAVAASKEWLKDHQPIPNQEVLAEFGLTEEDFERMGQTPLEAEPHHPGQ
jgi:hypothetical protein